MLKAVYLLFTYMFLHIFITDFAMYITYFCIEN